MDTIASTYGVTHPEALAHLHRAGLTGHDATTALGTLEALLEQGAKPAKLGADASRAHAVLARHA